MKQENSIADLEKKIHRIHKSTRTFWRHFHPLHNHLRMKFRWYYKWHLNPFAHLVHVSVLGLYLVGLGVFGYTLFQHPTVTKAASSQVFLRPNADFYPGFSPSSGSSDYAMINEAVADDMANYIYYGDPGGGLKLAVGVPGPNVPAGATDISLKIFGRAQSGLFMFVASFNGGQYTVNGSMSSVGATWTDFSDTFTTCPWTGSPWTVDDINKLDSMNTMVSMTSPDPALVTQEYLEVDYTSAGGGVVAPTVTTSAASSIGSTSVTGNGEVTADGGDTVTDRGFYNVADSSGGHDCSSASGGTQVTAGSGTGIYSGSIGSLTGSTYYCYRSYATNTAGTGYGAWTSYQTAAPYTISGTAYTSDAKSATINSCTNCVGISINGGNKTLVSTNGSGVFSFSGQTVAANNTITLYLTGGTYTGNLVTQAVDGTTNISGLELYANDVVLSHLTAGPMTNTLLATANNCADCGSDIKFTDSAGAVTFTTGYKVWIASGKTFTPGNTVTADAITIVGTFTPEANAVTLAGTGTPFVITGTFTTGTATVNYTGGATATNVTSATYYNLYLNHASTTYTAAGDITVSNIFTINAGTFDASSRTITLSGTGTPFVKTGTFTASTSQISYTGGTTATNVTSATYYNLYLNHASTTYTAAGDVTVSNIFTINAGTFDASSRTITLSGTGTPFVKTGTFTASTSTISYTGGTAATNITSTTYNNLTLNHASTTYTAAGDITVSSVLTITAGTFDASSRTITLSGTGTPFVATGTFTASTSTVSYTGGTAATNITSTTYNNLTLNHASTTYTAAGDITVSSVLTITAGTFDASSRTITLSGTGTPFVATGTFTASTSTISYTGGTTATNVTSTTYNNLTLSHSSTTYTAAGDITVSNVLTITAGTFDASSRTITLSGTGTPFVKTGTFTPSTSTISYTGGTTATNVTSATYYNLYLNHASTTYTAAGDITVSNIFTINAGTFDASSRTITLSGTTGTPFVKTGTLTPSTSTFIYSGNYASGNTTLVPATYNNLQVNNGSETYVAGGVLDVNGSLTITAGILNPGQNMTVAGDWSNSGTFTAGSNTVTLDGVGASTQVLNGSTTFNNLSATGTSARTIQFAGSSTQTVTGTWTATGASSQLLTLARKTGDSGVWSINPTVWSVDYVSVSNSTNLAGSKINPTHYTDGGGTTNWFLSLPSAASTVAIGTITTTGFTVTWADNSSNETGFKVFVSTVANADCSLATYPGTADYTTAANAVSQAVTGKSINTQYCAKVIATNADGDSSAAYSSPAYTLANVPGTPTFGTVTSTTIPVLIAQNSNPANTTYAIKVVNGGTHYVQANGTLGASAVWQTYATWGSSQTVTGLSANTQYTFSVAATNGDSTPTAYSTTAAKYTLASTPAAPTLTVVSTTSINIVLTDNGATTYAVAVSADGGSTWNYVHQADGATQVSADWQNYAAWGSGSGVTNISLSPNVQYTYKVEAHNGEGAASSFGSTAANYTLANVPSAPTVNTPTISSLKVIINQNSNPAGTTYAILNDTATQYIQANGTLGASAVWQDYTTWGGASGVVNTGLTSNTSYSYKVKAKNGDLIATALSSAGTLSTILDTPDISGHVYTDAAKTPLASGKSVAVSVNGGAIAGSGTTDASGAFMIPNITLAAGDTIALFVNETGIEANLFTLAVDGTSNISGLELYTQKIVLRSESATSITNANLKTALSCSNCGSHLHLVNPSASKINFDEGYELVVDTGKTFALSGEIGTVGNLDLNGSVNLGSNYLTITGNLDVGAGSIVQSGSTLTFSRTTGNQTITTNGQSLGNVVFTGGATRQIVGTTTINGTLTQSGGVLDLNTYDPNITIKHDVALASGSVSKGSGTITLAGDLNYLAASGINPGNVAIGASPDTVTLSANAEYDSLIINPGDILVTDGYNVTVHNDLTIDGTLNAAHNGARNSTILVGGAWTNAGVFTADNSTVNLNGAGGSTQLISGNTTFNNLSATGASARTIQFAGSSAQTVTGTWTATGASSQLLTLALKTGDSGVWSINPTSWSVDYASVSNSINLASSIINPTHSTDGGGTTNWFVSDHLQVILRPTSDYSVGLTPSSGSSNWAMVDDVVADDNSTYNSISNDFQTDLYGHGDSSIPAGSTINSVRVFERVSYSMSIGLRVFTEGTQYSGYGGSGQFDWVTGDYTWATNPNTNLPWTLQEITDLKFGAYVGRGSGEAKLTQVYAVVDYTLPVIVVPTVTTSAASAIALTSFTGHGEVTADGGASVTDRGFYSVDNTPNMENCSGAAGGNQMTSGSGTGVYSASIGSLTTNTYYCYRSYATNSAGIGYGAWTSVLVATPPTVTTSAATAITSSSATLNGEVVTQGSSTVFDRGFDFTIDSSVGHNCAEATLTSSDWVSSGSGIGVYHLDESSLAASTHYCYLSYANNGYAFGSGASWVGFQTLAPPVAPTVTTSAASAVAATSFTGHGEVTADGGATVTGRGFFYFVDTSIGYDCSSIPSTTYVSEGSGTGVFSKSIGSLTANTHYCYQASAINSAGTGTGAWVGFRTSATNTVTVTAGSNGVTDKTGANSVDYNGSLAVLITPNSHYHIASITLGGVSQSISNSAGETFTVSNVTAPITLAVTFSIDTYNVTALAGGNGSISPSGVTVVNSGASQGFTITPSSGYHISSIVIDGTYQTGSLTSPYTFTNVIQNHTIAVYFIADGICLWDGRGVDNNWNTDANWTGNAKPTASCDVIFDATSTKASTLDTSFTNHIKSLSINSSYTGTITLAKDLDDDGNITLAAGTLKAGNYTLNIGGSWTNTGGTFTADTSTVNFNGATASTVASNSNDFYRVTFAGVAQTSAPNVWVANFNSTYVGSPIFGNTNVSKIDSSSGARVGDYVTGSYSYGVAVDANGFAWVTNTGDNTVSKINVTTGAKVADFATGSTPRGVAIDANGFVWVANYGSSNVSKINPDTGAKTNYATGQNPYSVAVDANGFVWVANNYTTYLVAGTVSKINASTGAKVADYITGPNSYGVAVDGNGFVWVTNSFDSTISKINGSTGAKVADYPTGSGPAGVAVDSTGFVWVANTGANTVSKINPTTGAKTDYPTGSGPAGVSIDNNGFVWVANTAANTISKINPSSGAKTDYPVGDSPYSFGDMTGYALKHFVLGDSSGLGNSGAYTLSSNLVVSSELRVSSGAVSAGANTISTNSFIQTGGYVMAPSTTLTVAGDFQRTSGVFARNSGTVSLAGGDGSTQVVSGDTTFNNFSITTTSTRTVQFAGGSTQTILGTWTATGASNQLLALAKKTGDSGVWSINPTTWSVDYVNVADSTNLASATISPAHYDSASLTASNTNWFALALVSHTITSSIVGANGSITPLGATQVVDGNSQTFTVTPTAGYHISDIKIDSVSLTGALADTYTFTNVKADHTIVITFAANDICLWDGGGADDNWSTAANWSNDTLPSISCDVVFDSTSSKNSVINASFANHIRSFTVNIGYLGTIFADTNLADDGNFNLNAGTFFASNSTISIGGSLSLSASSAATFNKGTSTINFDPTTAGKTIRTSGQQLGNLIFNGIDTIPAGMIIGTSQASTTGLIGNHTLKAGWTLQDSLSATALTAKTGALVDNGNAVTIAGNISIADKVGILASTGLWTQSASGNIANTAACNTFGSLTIAGAGVATTLTDGVRVGWGGGLGALTMGPGTLYGNSMSIVDYFSARVGGGVTVNNVIVGSKLAGFTLYPMGSASSQKAITLPNNFASTIQIQKQYYTVFTATGDFNFGNANLYINNDSDNLSTGSVDMGPYSLTCNNLTIGSTFGSAQFPSYYRIAGALKLGTGTINVGGNLTYGNALNFSNKLDLGSGTLNVVGNLDLNYITLVQGTSTVDLVGTGTISVTNSNNQSFYNLRCAHSGKTTRIISPAIRVLNILSTYSGGTLADKIVYLDKSDGDPFIDTGATLSNSTFLYVSSHSISVSGHNFAAVAYRSYYNDVVYTLTSNLSATNGVAIYSNTQDKAATLNAGTSNISTTNLRLGNAYDPNVLSYTGAIDFGSGNHVLTGTLMRDPLSTSTDFAINFNKSTVSIGGGADFSNITVTPGTSTVILNGAGGTTQTISGSATFNNLYASATSARAIRFAAGSTQTVLGTWTATGAPNQLLTLGLKAGDTGVWKINPTLWNVDYVNVSNSTNLASAKIDPTHSIDGGGNTNWFEGVIPRIIPTEPVSETISGTVAKIVSSTVQSIVGVATAVADVVKNTYEIVAQSIVGQAVVAVASAITNMLSKIGLTPEVASRVAAATAAIVTVVTAAIAPIAATGSLMNLGEIAHSIWQPIANLVTGKRRRNWGRVIEDGTGVPIPNTKINLVKVYRESPVVMYESQKVVASTYTDKNGKYGFIAEPGKYKLEIIKDNYEVVDTNSFLDFYHTNTLFEVKDYKQGLVIKDIAVSTGSENLLKMFKVTHLMQIIGKILAYASFGFLIFGTISIIPIIVGHLSLLNIGIMILYVFLWILNGKNLMKKSPWGVVVDKTKDTNLPLVLVRVIDKKTGQLVKTAVSNEKGRFSTFIDKGDYEIKALKAGYILDNPIHYAVGKEKTTLSKKIELRPI